MGLDSGVKKGAILHLSVILLKNNDLGCQVKFSLRDPLALEDQRSGA